MTALAAVSGILAVCSGGILTQHAHLLRDLPPWAELHTQHEERSMHAVAGEESVSIALQNGMLHLTGAAFDYASPPDWAVADCFVCDLDRDGADELMLHVWKRGSFGTHQPFWQKPDDKARCTEHLFIYDWDLQRESRLVPLWMSSQIPVQGQKITVIEAGIIRIEAPDGKESLWQWGSWGVVRIDA